MNITPLTHNSLSIQFQPWLKNLGSERNTPISHPPIFTPSLGTQKQMYPWCTALQQTTVKHCAVALVTANGFHLVWPEILRADVLFISFPISELFKIQISRGAAWGLFQKCHRSKLHRWSCGLFVPFRKVKPSTTLSRCVHLQLREVN